MEAFYIKGLTDNINRTVAELGIYSTNMVGL